MADGRTQAKKGSPRWEALTKGAANQYYLARRYFNYTVDEWDALPWWQAALYLQGLEDQGIIGDKDAPTNQSVESKPGTALNTDYAADGPLPPGFTTRRAG